VEEVPEIGEREPGQSRPPIVQEIEDFLSRQKQTGGPPPARERHHQELHHQKCRRDENRVDADRLQPGEDLAPAVATRRVIRCSNH
jgi:hypothetical protein